MQKSAIWGLVSFVLAGLGLGADLMSHKKACEELAEAKGIGEEKQRQEKPDFDGWLVVPPDTVIEQKEEEA